MIHLPITFRLFSQQWTIRTALPGEIPEDLGQCRPDLHEIVVNPNQSQESMAHTIMHEITHSIELKQHLELTERQVDLIALGFIDLFRRTPDLMEIIQDASQ